MLLNTLKNLLFRGGLYVKGLGAMGGLLGNLSTENGGKLMLRKFGEGVFRCYICKRDIQRHFKLTFHTKTSQPYEF